MFRFSLSTAIPSAYNVGKHNRVDYYNQPWEMRADMLAGIWRDGIHGRFSIEAYVLYLAYYDYIDSLSDWELFLALINGDIDDFKNHDFSALGLSKDF